MSDRDARIDWTTAFTRYWDWHGRSTRREFWLFFTFIPGSLILLLLIPGIRVGMEGG